MDKIYYNGYFVYFINENKLIKRINLKPDIIITEEELPSFADFFSGLEPTDKINKIFVLTPDARHLFRKLKTNAPMIVAAGGLVVNKEGKLLMIKRKGLWDLPKGKTEGRETLRETALREVEEECSIGQLTINEKLCATYHMYYEKRWVLKKSVWYAMSSPDTQTPHPQEKESITEAVWLDKIEVAERMPDTYPNIRDLIHAFYLLS